MFAAAADEISYIDVHRAKQLYDDGALFIDTRTLSERKRGIIEGSLAMKASEVDDVAQNLLTDKDQLVVTYCVVGARAADTAARLKALGYSNLYVIAEGQGYSNWENAGYPTSR